MPGVIQPAIIGSVASLAVVTFLTSYPKSAAHKKKTKDAQVPDTWIDVKQSNGKYITLHEFKKRIRDPDYYDQELDYVQNCPQTGRHWQKKQAALFQRRVKLERRQGSTEALEEQQRAAGLYGRG